MGKNGDGLNKARTIIYIISSAATVLGIIITILFFFFKLQTDLENISINFNKHSAEAADKINTLASQKDLNRVDDNLKKHVAKNILELAQFVPKSELAIEYRVIKETLGDIKGQLKSCQEEDKIFKDKIFELILKIEQDN